MGKRPVIYNLFYTNHFISEQRLLNKGFSCVAPPAVGLFKLEIYLAVYMYDIKGSTHGSMIIVW